MNSQKAASSIGEIQNRIPGTHVDPLAGQLRKDILDENVMSAIVEIKVRVERIIRLVWEVGKELDTVVVLGLEPAATPRERTTW